LDELEDESILLELLLELYPSELLEEDELYPSELLLDELLLELDEDELYPPELLDELESIELLDELDNELDELQLPHTKGTLLVNTTPVQ